MSEHNDQGQGAGKQAVPIAISMGDAAGVGPELCLRALESSAVNAVCRPIVFGRAALLRRVARQCDLPLDASILSVSELFAHGLPRGTSAVVVDSGYLAADAVMPGRVQSACGEAAFRFVKDSVSAIQQGMIRGLVTAPLHKEALQQAGVPYHGHTEMLAALTGTRTYCMMMASMEINVCLATTHLALERVPAMLTVDRILEVIRLADVAMRRFGRTEPRLTVCALNPHAGENGLFGDQEQRVIQPAITAARKAGFCVSDPLPSDTAFIPAMRAQTDAYIVMYHDQGLIPFKMLAFDTGVNVTLGLPIVRTSVDHGTAFDIAWQGRASVESLVAAVETAVRLVVS